MATFIKAGFWETLCQKCTGYKSWLNLDQFVENKINSSEGEWIDYSNTSNIIGWSNFSTKVIKYKLSGKTLFVNFNIEGVSNNTLTSFTLPLTAIGTITSNIIPAINDSVDTIAYGIVNSNIVSFRRYTKLLAGVVSAPTDNIWTIGNTKKIAGQLIIEI